MNFKMSILVVLTTLLLSTIRAALANCEDTAALPSIDSAKVVVVYVDPNPQAGSADEKAFRGFAADLWALLAPNDHLIIRAAVASHAVTAVELWKRDADDAR